LPSITNKRAAILCFLRKKGHVSVILALVEKV